MAKPKKRYKRNGKLHRTKRYYRCKTYKRKPGRKRLKKGTWTNWVPIEEEVRKILARDNIYFVMNNKKKKYDKRILKVTEEYNMFQYLHPVRMYIQKKYDITLHLLELLLYLHPKKYFTWREYKDYPKRFTYTKVRKLVDEGFLVDVRPVGARSQHIFKLSLKSENIVRRFYEYLSGEKKMPTNPTYNPLLIDNPNTQQEKVMNMISQMKQIKEPLFPTEAED